VKGTTAVVVGGGLAGLSAALELADAGASVTLLERRPRLGGATWSFQRNGHWFDNGQHVFLRCCTEYQAFLRRIGSDGDIRLQQRLSLPVVAPGGRTAWLRRDPLPAPLHLTRSVLGFRHLSVGDRLRFGRAALKLRGLDLDDPALDETTFADFLRRHGQRQEAIERLWNLICVPTVNLPAEEASLTLAAMVFQVGLLTDGPASDIGWADVPLAQLHADPARRALERLGAVVRTDAGADAVELEGDDVIVHAGGQRLEPQVVVVAVPPDAAATLLPASLVPAAPTWPDLGTSPVVDVHLLYDRQVVPHELVAGVGTPVQFVFDRTASAGVESGQCLAVSLSAADRWLGTPPDELLTMVERELTQLFPSVALARRVDGIVTRERAATFRGRPGTWALRPATRSAPPGIYLAGAWTDTGWPATMEGAVRSGVAAARAAVEDHRQARLRQDVAA
jgi:squalene-associated FAD-dependent desaturase